MKKSPHSLTEIRKVLREMAFNPKKPGPMKIITDQRNQQYWTHRAMEAIQMSLVTADHEDYQNQLTMSIRLLTLCKIESEHGRKEVQK